MQKPGCVFSLRFLYPGTFPLAPDGNALAPPDLAVRAQLTILPGIFITAGIAADLGMVEAGVATTETLRGRLATGGRDGAEDSAVRDQALSH